MIDILQLVTTTLTVCIVQAIWNDFREKLKNKRKQSASKQRKTQKRGKKK